MARCMLRIAGNAKSIVELPWGAGRFRGLLVEGPDRILYPV